MVDHEGLIGCASPCWQRVLRTHDRLRYAPSSNLRPMDLMSMTVIPSDNSQ